MILNHFNSKIMEVYNSTGLVLSTSDLSVAKKYQLQTKIATRDGNVYTSWLIFSNVEYFEKMRDSGMEESHDFPTLFFEHLNNEECRVYLRSIVDISVIDTSLSTDSIVNIYRQADFHCIERIADKCMKFMRSLPLSEEAYRLLSMDTSVLAEMYMKPGTTFRPPFSDGNFWHKLCCELKKKDQLLAWQIAFQFMDEDQYEKLHQTDLYYFTYRERCEIGTLLEYYIKYPPNNFKVAMKHVLAIC